MMLSIFCVSQPIGSISLPLHIFQLLLFSLTALGFPFSPVFVFHLATWSLFWLSSFPWSLPQRHLLSSRIGIASILVLIAWHAGHGTLPLSLCVHLIRKTSLITELVQNVMDNHPNSLVEPNRVELGCRYEWKRSTSHLERFTFKCEFCKSKKMPVGRNLSNNP